MAGLRLFVRIPPPLSRRRIPRLSAASARPLIRALCVVVVSGIGVHGQDAANFFRSTCYSCHTIGGGRLTGPDLKDVTTRRDRPWLVSFMLNPKDVIESGDPYAQQLLRDARGVIMPRVPNLDRARAESLLDLIESEGRLEESNFRGLEVSDRPLQASEISAGADLFRGVRRLAGGGPPCLSCHSVTGLGGFGGGRIGPDLTKVFERMGGRRALSAWLLAPQTRTMAARFSAVPLTQEEIPLIAAFLEDRARNAAEEDPGGRESALLLAAVLGGVLISWSLDRVVSRDSSRAKEPDTSHSQPKTHPVVPPGSLN